MTQDVEMKEQPAPSISVISSSPSTLHHLKEIASLIETKHMTEDEHEMEVDTAALATQPLAKHSLPELEIYCYLLVLIFLIDQQKYDKAKACSSASIAWMKNLKRRTLDVLATRFYFYYSLCYELTGTLAKIRSNLLALHWITTLRHDEQSQCPRQSGGTESGYYVCKFMKEIIENGLEVLVNKNVGDGKEEYIDDDIDDIRKEWAKEITLQLPQEYTPILENTLSQREDYKFANLQENPHKA
ncbi:putative 26S proteasome non-ATPase regulatory subunit 3 [Hibiscus syriacus]|uniref:26S proteasome non-ATPase regulatory subunit 3 n=1 Tax=Hibiscus syriacus TaxID=106335 RepID=A0A6A3AX21_HIBSY|nr:putative 26S proteasome non-ATPase regulatory subunit 3 [Hibiscus syriacus]